MSTWADLERESPAIAEAGRRLLGEVAFLATVSDQGRPRVHPFCPALYDGGLWAFVMERSPKRRDLDANAHFAVHALPGAQDEELYVAGRATRVRDAHTRAEVLARMPYDEADDEHLLYRFDLERALWTTWVDFQTPSMRPVHHVWRRTRTSS